MGALPLVPFASALQPADRIPYSRPYVAEYCDPDSAIDPRDCLCLADACRTDAASEERGVGSGFRQRNDGKYFRRSDRDGPDQGNSLSRVHFFWRYVAPDRAHSATEHGSPCWCSRERGPKSSRFAHTENDGVSERTHRRLASRNR
jgi:hypothetical protein